MQWAVAIAAFHASAVKIVEAFTIVLVVGVTINWRSALVGAFAAAATVAKKYVWVNQSVTRDDYPHKRSMMSWDKAECRVTDLIQPFTYILPDSIRRPRGDGGGNRSASPAPIYDAEFRLFSVMVG